MMEKKKIKKKKIDKERKLEVELIYIIGFMVFLVVVFLLTSSYFKSKNTFDYEDMTFNKGRVGKILFYHHFYYYKTLGGKLIQYNLYLRNDPRENNIPVEGKKIIFGRIENNYISIDSERLKHCPYSVLAAGNLASFFINNEINIKGANFNETQANLTNQEFVSCKTHPNNRIVEIKEGDETKIILGDKCYEIFVANCEILEAVEKFEVQTIIDYIKKR